MKIDKYKFVRTYVLFGITVSALTSLMFGLLAVIMHNQALITMYYIFLFAVPILSATHIVCTHLWDDGNMAVKNRKIVLPIMIVCIIFVFVFLCIYL